MFYVLDLISPQPLIDYQFIRVGQVKVWDAEERKCVAALIGHTGSIKSISSHPTNSGMFMILFIHS